MEETSELDYCPIKDSECNIKPEIYGTPSCFIAIPFRSEWKDTRKTITRLLKKHKITPYIADEDVTTGRDILCKVCEKITNSDFGVMEISARNPNVMIEFGLTLGRRKPVFILYNKRTGEPKGTIPVDITALDRIEYANQEVLAERFEKGLKKHLQRLDVSKKRVSTLADLAIGMACEGKLKNAESIVLALVDVLRSAGRFDGLLIDVVVQLYENSDPNTFRYLRYGSTLMRLLAGAGDLDTAMKEFDRQSEVMREFVVSGYKSRADVSKQAANQNLQWVLGSLEDKERPMPLYRLHRMYIRSRRHGEFELEAFYRELWRLMFDLGKRQASLLEAITRRIKRGLTPSGFRLARQFWEDELTYAFIFWILNSPKFEAKHLNRRIGVAKRSIKRVLPRYLTASVHVQRAIRVR